ncbi:MAG: hypothetical protein IPM79_20150 [Polyangiaceae bacterium]|nr:hypothetical protein [Polyangiaceae bacterium]
MQLAGEVEAASSPARGAGERDEGVELGEQPILEHRRLTPRVEPPHSPQAPERGDVFHEVARELMEVRCLQVLALSASGAAVDAALLVDGPGVAPGDELGRRDVDAVEERRGAHARGERSGRGFLVGRPRGEGERRGAIRDGQAEPRGDLLGLTDHVLVAVGGEQHELAQPVSGALHQGRCVGALERDARQERERREHLLGLVARLRERQLVGAKQHLLERLPQDLGVLADRVVAHLRPAPRRSSPGRALRSRA